jgi:molecular chaperone HtpG
MIIPKRLAYILERDQALDGAVKLSIANFEPWIKNSTLPFFPEYTKHDIDHIEAVLRTSAGLIRDSAWDAITASDAGVLILAVLLHDCAMHLSEDGFVSLLQEPRSEQRVEGLEDRPWRLLWEEFLGEASRFDGRKLQRLFGDIQPVRRPPLEPGEMKLRDRLLIGEFLRRHHARLAHEIALFGVPTLSVTPLVLKSLQDERAHIAAIAGVVARSHGSDVRHLLPYLQTFFDIRQYKGVHPVFLMTLLRVGDYLQIESDRAPAQVLQVRSLTSPLSNAEWKAHQAVKDVRTTHEDPEAIYVDALPEHVDEFLRIQAWVKGIQNELDLSWAVLGEVYGRYEGLNTLGLILRRVRSSLDNVDEFAKRVSYVPRKAHFRAAGADLLKLLIAPLYGDRPEIGIRELVQNAVDAVRELDLYRQDGLRSQTITQTPQDSDVVISIEANQEGAKLTASDKGIGMTVDTVIDYFFNAGASFRRSDDWRKVFETVEGKSKVLRAGRFGVGALASFLLGSRLEVSTRHVDDDVGVKFIAGVDTDSVELVRFERPVGTTVTIALEDSVFAKLSKQLEEHHYYQREDWDWYCLRKPSVSRIFLGNTLPQKHDLFSPTDKIPVQWRETSHPAFVGIYWTYRAWIQRGESQTPALTCNGIVVAMHVDLEWSQRFALTMPILSVFDPDGHLPLDLQRTGITSAYPFEKELVDDVIRDFIAFALVNGPSTVPDTSAGRRAISKLVCPSSARTYPWADEIGQEWFFTSDGFGYFDAAILYEEGFRSALILYLSEAELSGIVVTPSVSYPTIVAYNDGNLTSFDYWIRQAVELGFYATHDMEAVSWNPSGIQVLNRMRRKGARILISNEMLTRARGKGKLPRSYIERLDEEWTGDDWHVMKVGDCPDSSADLVSFARTQGDKLSARSAVVEIYFDEGNPPRSPIGTAWMETLGQSIIPFDPNKRSQQLETAFKRLKGYIDRYVMLNKTDKSFLE